MTIQASSTLSTIYQLLAECLSEPPEWFATAGKDWELYTLAMTLSDDLDYPPLENALHNIATISPETLSHRERRYRNLIRGTHAEPLPVYESLALEGRLHGAATFHAWTVYRAAGLQIVGAVLPDHASIELAFLAYLINQELEATQDKSQWRKVRREFIKQHAKKWLPSLGRAMANSKDPVYRPPGLLLTALIQAETMPPRRKRATPERLLPQMLSTDCTLCSFCAQVCPVQALTVTETRDKTSLHIRDEKCVSCDKCVTICPQNILQLSVGETVAGFRRLYESPRERCPGCDTPTVSRAEVLEIANQLGEHPRWLDYCSDCRVVFMRELR